MMIVMSGKLLFRKLLFGFSFAGLLFSCVPNEVQKKKVGIVNFNAFQEQILGANSKAEVKQIDDKVFEIIRDSSLNRVLPKVWAEDQHGIKVNLSLLIDKPTLMVITSPYAQWGTVDLARDLPEALEGLESKYRILCLLLKEPAPEGVEIPEDFYKVQLEQLTQLFPNSYLIRNSEAQKLNIYSLPSRYYFNENGVISKISPTAISPSKLKQEIKAHLGGEPDS